MAKLTLFCPTLYMNLYKKKPLLNLGSALDVLLKLLYHKVVIILKHA